MNKVLVGCKMSLLEMQEDSLTLVDCNPNSYILHLVRKF